MGQVVKKHDAYDALRHRLKATDWVSRGIQYIHGDRIPQYPLIPFLIWARLRKGEISKYTVYTTTGSWQKAQHDHAVVVTKEDCP